jgi:hypothetical protein
MVTGIVLLPREVVAATEAEGWLPGFHATRTKDRIFLPPTQVPPESTNVPPVIQNRTVAAELRLPDTVYK